MELRKKYHEYLKDIKDDVLRMCEAVDGSLKISLSILKAPETHLSSIETVSEKRNEIKEIARQILESSVRILALEAPVASELRSIIAWLNIVSSFEHLAKHAYKLATINQKVSKKIMREVIDDFETMAKKDIEMLNCVYETIRTQDLSILARLKDMDDYLDATYTSVREKIIPEMKKMDRVEDGLEIVLLARHLEKAGGHINNIAEWVYFSITGEHQI